MAIIGHRHIVVIVPEYFKVISAEIMGKSRFYQLNQGESCRPRNA